MALATKSAYFVPKARCDNFCQHPCCWGYYSQTHPKKNSLPGEHHAKSLSEKSDDELSLPTQSICNLLSDYGIDENKSTSQSGLEFDTCHNKENMTWSLSSHNLLNSWKTSKRSHNKTLNDKKDSQSATSSSSKLLVKVQDGLKADAFQYDFDEVLFPRHYVWVPNSNEPRKKAEKSSIRESNNVITDLTKTVLNPEILLKTDEPSKRNKENQENSPTKIMKPPRNMQRLKMSPSFYESHISPRHKLYPTSKESSVKYEPKNAAFTVEKLIQQKQVKLLKDPKERTKENVIEPLNRLVLHLDTANGLKEKTSSDSVTVNEKIKNQETFHKGELPNLQTLAKIPSISLGLPELPSGLKTTKPFTYKKQDFDFSLGPVFSTPSSHRSVFSVESSKNGQALRSHGSAIVRQQSQAIVQDHDDQSQRSVTLSIRLPVPPVMTPKMIPPSSRSINYNLDTSIKALNLQQLDPQGDGDQILATRPTSANVGEESSVQVLTGEDDKSNKSVRLPYLTDRSQDSEPTAAEELCPTPDQWPLVVESSFEDMPKPLVPEAALNAKYEGQKNKAKSSHIVMRRTSAKDEKMVADSPAPPPPSPEPKEPSDMWRGNDLKALASASMEPLLEVEESQTM